MMNALNACTHGNVRSQSINYAFVYCVINITLNTFKHTTFSNILKIEKVKEELEPDDDIIKMEWICFVKLQREREKACYC